MVNLYDLAYAIGLATSAPLWMLRARSRTKVLGALRDRMARSLPPHPMPDAAGPCVLVHAVSVGEINATRTLIAQLAERHPSMRFVVTVTTATGHERGLALYASDPRVALVRYPLDFSGAIDRLLDAYRPDLVVLMELEVWPNFVRRCARRGVRVMLANGRITDTSFSRYQAISLVSRPMFRRLAAVAAQDDLYAQRFMSLGARIDRLHVVGTMKFDTATVADRVDGDATLAAEVGLRPGDETIWVCGSSGPGEEEIVLRVYRSLLRRFPKLRLVIVPRKPERFDEVAGLIEQARFRCVRRSTRTPPEPSDFPIPPVVLGDTMGELRKFYAIADVVFVGRSLVNLGSAQHGSDMIEPAALGKPVVVGPWTHNFAEAMRAFRRRDAVFVVEDEASLEESIRVLLHSPVETAAMARRARQVVLDEKGSTERHVHLIEQVLADPPPET
jgi:3-deoxy-D-manno-octulosonic-acid transferase